VAQEASLKIVSALAQNEQLFLSLAEQMKVPLMHISRQAEAGQLLGNSSKVLADVHIQADMALRLIDGYMLSMRLHAERTLLPKDDTVTVSSMLYDAAQNLHPIAKLYGVEIEVITAGKYGPVAAHGYSVQTALTSLGYALIEALPATNARQLRLKLVAHRCRYGIATGIYTDSDIVTVEALRRGRELQGRARQPMPSLTHTSGAGVFVADAILQALGKRLRVSHYQKQCGLGTVLQINPQLQLV
jgi:hypothetical protein